MMWAELCLKCGSACRVGETPQPTTGEAPNTSVPAGVGIASPGATDRATGIGAAAFRIGGDGEGHRYPRRRDELNRVASPVLGSARSSGLYPDARTARKGEEAD